MKNFLINIGLVVLVIAAIIVLLRLPFLLAGACLGLAAWMALTASGRRTASVTAVGFSTLRNRIGSSSVIVIGIAGVVAVLIALLAMGEGFRATLQSGGRDDTAIVMRAGSVSESSSILVRNDIDIVSQAPGIARDAEGKPLVSAELMVPVSVRSKDSADDANIPLRGVDANAWALRPQLRIIEGRAFKTGLRELVVGQSARNQFEGLEPGDDLKLGTQVWKVVGVFASGDAYDSELWADRQSIASTYRRGSSVSSILTKLSGASSIARLQAALKADPRITVDAITTREFFARQSAGLVKTTRLVGTVVGVIMGIGAVFGALNCMFAAVMTRSREIGTLRAIGFQGLPVIVSVMLETMLLALVGGVLGALIAWLVFNGYSVSTLSGFNQVAFEFKVTPGLMWSGLKWALMIGFIGGLFPAVRAVRIPITAALRES